MKKTIKRVFSSIILSAFLSTNIAYPQAQEFNKASANSNLRALSFKEKNGNGPNTEAVVREETPFGEGSFPLMIPAGVKEIERMFEPAFGDDSKRIAQSIVEAKRIKAPRRGAGETVTRGAISLTIGDDGQVKGAISTAMPAGTLPQLVHDMLKVDGLINSAWAWLQERQGVGVIGDALRAVVHDRDVIQIEYRQDHDRLMNLSPLSRLEDNPRSIFFDTDIPAKLAKPENQQGLQILYSLGMLHQFYCLSGISQYRALFKVLECYESLTPQEQVVFTDFLKRCQGDIDNGGNFLAFLTKGANAPYLAKQQQAALLMKLEMADLAYNDSVVASRVLAENGRPRLDEFSLTEIREMTHKGVSESYSNELETLNAIRVARAAQERGMELVMGFLGRAGLIEQLLMAAAKSVPAAQLRAPVRKIYEAFQAQDFSGIQTPELKELAKKWKAASGELQQLSNILSDQTVPEAQLVGRIKDFTEALNSFLADARAKVDDIKRKKKAVIAQELSRDGNSKTYEQFQQDLALVSGTVDGFISRIFVELEVSAENLPDFKKVINIAYQRLVDRETLNLFLLNRLLDPYLGETPDFRQLLNEGGQSLHVSANMGPWLQHVTHWIQALPAYAWYKVVDLPGDNYRLLPGCERDILEFAFKGYTDDITLNIEEVMHLEHASLARTYLAEAMGPDFKAEVGLAVETLKARNDPAPTREEAIRLLLRQRAVKAGANVNNTAASVAVLVDATYRNLERQVAGYVAAQEAEGRYIERAQALDGLIRFRDEQGKALEGNLIAELLDSVQGQDPDGARLRQAADTLITRQNLGKMHKTMRQLALLRRKDQPSFHNLTTLGPGETTTFLKNWLETGISLHLFCRENNLDARVKARVDEYRKRMSTAAWRVIQDLELRGDLYEFMVENGMDPNNQQQVLRAAPVMIGRFPVEVGAQVGRICAIMEYEERKGLRNKADPFDQDPKSVTDYIEKHGDQLENEALDWVVGHYEDLKAKTENLATTKRITWRQAAQQAIKQEEDADLRAEYQAEVRCFKNHLARKAVCKQFNLEDDAAAYNRLHSGPLTLFTARQEIVGEFIAENHLSQGVLNEARYRYESEGPYKKFNTQYTPSRVDLGEGERASVELTGKVTTADTQAALNKASGLHNLYNVSGTVQFRSTAMGEFFKARENFFTRGGPFYLSLGEGINIDAIMVGDQEEYMYYSNLRADRIVLPTGESYRGFCVPKEFFLLYAVMAAPVDREVSTKILLNFAPPGRIAEFKELIYQSYEYFDEQLKSWKAYDSYEAFAATFNDTKLKHRVKTDTFLGDMRKGLNIGAKDSVEWEAKAQEFFEGRYEKYFSVLGADAFLMRLPALSRSLQAWGITMTEEELNTRMLLFELANWANKKLQGGEQINRVGPYRKLELDRELVEEAIARCQDAGRRVKDRRDLVMTTGGPYKAGTRVGGQERPITDARFSAAATKLFCVAGTDQHCREDFDPEGRRVIDRMAEGFIVPADFRIAGTVGAQDIFTAIPGAFDGTVIDEVKNVLLGFGMAPKEIKASCTLHGAALWKWHMPAAAEKDPARRKEWEALQQDQRFLRKLHLLVLEERDVIKNYDEAVQGADVVDFAVGDPGLLDLVDNLPKLISLMRRENPDGLLVFADGQVGARPRSFATRQVTAEYKVKELFALDNTAVYGCLGLGKDTIDRWREEMTAERQQAQELLQALQARNYDKAREIYAAIVQDVIFYKKAEHAASLEIRARKAKLWEKSIHYTARCLGNVKAGLPLQRLDFATWLALGGRYVINGKMSEEDFNKLRVKFEEEMTWMTKDKEAVEVPTNVLTLNRADIDQAQAAFLKPDYATDKIREYSEEKTGIVTVGKTGGAREVAISGRAIRRQKEKLQLMLNERRQALAADYKGMGEPINNAASFEEAYQKAAGCMGTPDAIIDQQQFSNLLYWTQAACFKALDRVIPDTADKARLKEKQAMQERIKKHLAAGAIDPDMHRAVLKDLMRLIELESRRLEHAGFDKNTANKSVFEELAKAQELLDAVLLISLEYDIDLATEQNKEAAATTALFNFFDKTLNVHAFDYFPFLIQPSLADGPFDKWYSHDEKFRFACERHHWLYPRLRNIITQKTAMRHKDARYHDVWLGNASDWQHPDTWKTGLGLNPESVPVVSQRYWYSYTKLRDAVAMMNELSGLGYASNLNGIPEVFVDVDPAVLGADENGAFTNILCVYPQGNTTIPVGVEQGAALEKDGYNLMLCPFPVRIYDGAYGKEVLQARDALMYVSAERYKMLLMKSGVPSQQAAKMAAQVPTDGIIVAIKFKEPAKVTRQKDKGNVSYAGAVTAHSGFAHFTHPLRPYFDSLGIPIIQPLTYEAFTYLKGAVPEVLKGTGVVSPVSFVWGMSEARSAQADALKALKAKLHREPTQLEAEEAVKEKIRQKLWELMERYPVVTEAIVKPEKESGGRGAELLSVLSRKARRVGILQFAGSKETEQGKIDKETQECASGVRKTGLPEGAQNFNRLIDDVYEISQTDNAIVQGAVHSFVGTLFTPEFLKQVVEAKAKRGDVVLLDREPQTPLFSYFRYILSRGSGEDFQTAQNIVVISTEAIGNVARGSILRVYGDEIVNPEFRAPLRRAMDKGYYDSMKARQKYLKENWPHILREYLVLNRRFGVNIEAQLGSFLHNSHNEIVNEFFKQNGQFLAQRNDFRNFFIKWVDNLFGTDPQGREFSAALTADFPAFSVAFTRFLGEHLEKARLLNLEINYSMDDGMPMYMGDEDKNYLYVVKKNSDGSLALDDWGNIIMLPLIDGNGAPTDVKLYDKDGQEIARTDADGRAIPVRIFEESPTGELVEKEVYLDPEKKNRVSCIEGAIIEFNPGAGLWRPYDMDLRRLSPGRAGEGVNRVFRPLGERGKEIKAQQLLPNAHLVTAAEMNTAVVTPAHPGYFGAGEEIYVPKPAAKENTLEYFIETAARKALEDINGAKDYQFFADDVSLILTYAAIEAQLSANNGSWEALNGLPRQQVVDAALGFLAQPQLAATLRTRLDISDAANLNDMLANGIYRQSVAQAVFECIQQQKDAIGIRINAAVVDKEWAAGIFGTRPICGLVFDSPETLFADTVAAFQIDSRKHFGGIKNGINFIGVHKDWLTDDGKAVKQALVVGPGGLVTKCTFTEPVSLQAVGILGLNISTEQATHKQLSNKLEAAGVTVFNPYDAAVTMDSKSMTHTICAGNKTLIQPVNKLINLGMLQTPESRKGSLRDFVHDILEERGMLPGKKMVKPLQQTVNVVMQPDHGTEGILAKPVTLGVNVTGPRNEDIEFVNEEELARALEQMQLIQQAGDNAIIRETRGNVTYTKDGTERRIVVRLNAVQTMKGYIADTGVARVAGEPNQVMVSKDAGATTEDINEILWNLNFEGEPLRDKVDISTVINNMEQAAQAAAKELNAEGVIGVDLLLEASRDTNGNIKVDVVFLEANPRPALLAAAARIEQIEPGKRPESLPQAVNPGFYDALYTKLTKQQAPATAARIIAANRPAGQAASIAAQMTELSELARQSGFDTKARAGLGVAGGRLRRLMMHPDMSRFFGPALQEPTGAHDVKGRDQIAVLIQATGDNKIYVDTENPAFQENKNWIPADMPSMYPAPEVVTWSDYERAGTSMTKEILASLGYTNEQMTSDAMRRPIPLVANAIASLRTLRTGPEGERVQQVLGQGNFQGLRLCINGNLPRGGFSSSSAVVVAVLNAINAFYDLGLSEDTIVDIACQAEYGTGVKAGSLDQTAIEKGVAGKSMLISSNPRERYATIATFGVNTEQFGFIFPFSVARDRETAQWSNGMYAPQLAPGGKLTSIAVRKMTGKSAEIAAILLRLPIDKDFFQEVQQDLVSDGELDLDNRLKVYQYLRMLPERIPFNELQQRINENKDWYTNQLMELRHLNQADAVAETERTFEALFSGWQEPVFLRTTDDGTVVEETGVPLRAMVAYLYSEEAKNLYLLTHPEASWIEYVSRSQLGDRSFDIDFNALPGRDDMVAVLEWEAGLSGPELMEEWLKKFGAKPFNYNKGLSNAALDGAIAKIQQAIPEEGQAQDTQLHLMEGTNFFRGLALIDLIEAMLKRAFGDDAIAVRINAAGQGDFFQIHFDVTKVSAADIEDFMERAVYQRFGLTPEYKFVEVYSGGPAVGVSIGRLNEITDVSESLMQEAGILPARLAPEDDTAALLAVI